MIKRVSQYPLFYIPLILAPAILLVIVSLSTWSTVAGTNGDLYLYYKSAQQIGSGAIPYRDFRLEYPPGALVPFVVPWLLGGGSDLGFTSFRLLFLAQNAACLMFITLAVSFVTKQMGLSRRIPIIILTIYAAVSAPLIPWRYDIFPAMLTIFSVAALMRGRHLSAGFLLGLGTATKIYPIVLLPVIILFYITQKRRQLAISVGASFLIAIIVVVLPFYFVGRDGLMAFLSYHQQRGVQIESLSGGIFMLTNVSQYGLSPLVLNYGAWHIKSPFADNLAPLHILFFTSLYAVILWQAFLRFRSVEPDDRGSLFRNLIIFCTVSLLVFIVTNKVLSPQYLAWLFPFAALLAVRQAIWFATICAITTVITPFFYDALLNSELWIVVLLNIRNAMLVILLFWTCLPEKINGGSLQARRDSIPIRTITRGP